MDDDHQQEEFLLKWNDHHNSFFSIVQDLCASELLTDVTLACGAGEPIIFEAHKLMLSVCSTFFRNILTRKSRHQAHPIVFLKDVEPRHMEQLLQYMYRGEINVLQDDLGPLIETARALQVKGLADAPPGAGGGGGTQQPKKRPNLPSGVLPPPLQQHPPPLKKAKTNNSSKKQESQQMRHPPLPTSQLAQRLTQPKRPPFMPQLPTEPEPPESIRGGGGKEDQIDLYGAPVFGEQDNNSGDGTDYGAYTETELHTDEDSNYPHIDQVFGAPNSFLSGGTAAGQQQQQLQPGGDIGRLRYKCEECGKAFITPSKLQRHSYSHSGLRPFQCNICAKSFSQSANLKTHIKNTHPEVFTMSDMAMESPLPLPMSLQQQQQQSSLDSVGLQPSSAAVAAKAAFVAAAASAAAVAAANAANDGDPLNDDDDDDDIGGGEASSTATVAKTEPRDAPLAAPSSSNY